MRLRRGRIRHRSGCFSDRPMDASAIASAPRPQAGNRIVKPRLRQNRISLSGIWPRNGSSPEKPSASRSSAICSRWRKMSTTTTAARKERARWSGETTRRAIFRPGARLENRAAPGRAATSSAPACACIGALRSVRLATSRHRPSLRTRPLERLGGAYGL